MLQCLVITLVPFSFVAKNWKSPASFHCLSLFFSLFLTHTHTLMLSSAPMHTQLLTRRSLFLFLVHAHPNSYTTFIGRETFNGTHLHTHTHWHTHTHVGTRWHTHSKVNVPYRHRLSIINKSFRVGDSIQRRQQNLRINFFPSISHGCEKALSLSLTLSHTLTRSLSHSFLTFSSPM